MSFYGIPTLSKQINSSPDGSVNRQELDKHVEAILKDGWIEVPMPAGGFNFRELDDKLQLGDRIRYVCLDPEDDRILFRTGGWCLVISEDGEHLVYRSHAVDKNRQPVCFSLQADAVTNLWVKPAPRRLKVESLPTFTYPAEPPTKYASYLTDESGRSVHIKNHKGMYEKRVFETSKKFQKALRLKKWRWSVG